MIEIKRVQTTDSQYNFVESLLESTFPIDERRENKEQREYTDFKSIFMANVILHEGKPVGLVNFWNLGSVYYIEHYAVSPSLRNRGYGKSSLNEIKRVLCDKPIILEVEMPIGDIEKRRIDFYKRNGFVLNDVEYKQPPYRKDGGCIDMRIMSYNLLDDFDLNEAIKELHEKVYNYTKAF